MGQSNRYRFDDLRTLGSRLLSERGVAPDRASALVMVLLWFDAANAEKFGIATLPDWLDSIDRGSVNPKAEGSVRLEFNATAVIDGEGGLAPLILIRAARIAQEKAREVGAGIVRVVNLGGTCPSAPAVSDVGIGPAIGLAQGPGRSWSVAVPTLSNMPAVFSTELGQVGSAPPPWSIETFPPWSFPFADEGSRVISAYSVKAFEPLELLHEQMAARLNDPARGLGEVRPDDWQALRAEHLTTGLAISEPLAQTLRHRAERVGISWPAPVEEESRP